MIPDILWKKLNVTSDQQKNGTSKKEIGGTKETAIDDVTIV